MLHLVILAEGPTPEQSYGGLLITGVVTVTVALIGYFAAIRSRSHRNNDRDSEPQWLKDLRGEARRLRRENEEKDQKIDHYERIMMIYRIDPSTGRRLPNATQAFPDPPAPPNQN
jgi:hypothetical protein